MLKCEDCGNTTKFVHSVEGTQTRIYEDGDCVGVEEESLGTQELICDRCSSRNVLTK